MISTSSYNNYVNGKYKAYSIDGMTPDYPVYEKLLYPDMTKEIYDNNVGNLSDEDNKRRLIEEYYKKVLVKLDPAEVFRELGDCFLLSREESDDISNRHIVACWFEILLNDKVEEYRVNEFTTEVLERPAYIKEYLESIMRKDILEGFNSLSASYFYKKGLMLEEKARGLDDKMMALDYKKQAISLEETALNLEQNYNNSLSR